MVDTSQYSKRLSVLLLFFAFFFSLIVFKLIYLQVFKHDYYLNEALADHQGYRELESRRGEIYIRDSNADSFFRVATNTTLDTIFADPFLIEDPVFITDTLAPLLFDEESAKRREQLRLKEERKKLSADLTEEQVAEVLQPKSVEVLEKEFKENMLKSISSKIRESIILYQEPDDTMREEISKFGLTGIEVDSDKIVAYPPRIDNPKEYSVKLSSILDIDPGRLEVLLQGENRYVVLASKVEPKKSERIREIVDKNDDVFKGIGFEQKSYRFYPEENLAAQVIGFVDSETGRYGIEEYYNDLLQGEAGVFKTQLDGLGKQITVGDDTFIRPPKDGSDIYLTIERSIQMEVERLLKRAVKDSLADSGQVIVMNPVNGEIVALAHYPTFNPNEYWKALDTEEIFFEPDEENPDETIDDRIVTLTYASGKEYYFIVDEETNQRVQVLPVESQDGQIYYEKFKNGVGAGAYRNRVVSDVYEPGSVFKPLTMSAAIDDGSVTPNSTVIDNGPLYVDEYKINNAQGKHYGKITMTKVLEVSNNIGIAKVAQKIGRNLLYSYMKKYGFGSRTDIEQVGEKSGRVKIFTGWADSELATYAFGQGITATPIQMIAAFGAIANDGVLVKPTLIKKIKHADGSVDENDKDIVRRVISKKTADTMIAMLTSVVHNGQAKNALVDGYLVAGKTGTSQTYRYGKPLEGPGTTIASFTGFVPASDPKYVILVKIDKPRTSPWGSQIAAPLFSKIASYILRYSGIPPDKY